MRRYHIEAFVNVLKLSPARRQTALERTLERLESYPPAVRKLLAPPVKQAPEAQHEALALAEEARTAKELTMHATGARETDIKLDRLLTALRDALEIIAETFAPEPAALARNL